MRGRSGKVTKMTANRAERPRRSRNHAMPKTLTIMLLLAIAMPLLAMDCGDPTQDPPWFEGNARLSPIWSPDSDRIAFSYFKRLLYVVETDGSNLQLMFQPGDDFAYADFSPDISPDGTRVVFVTHRHQPRFFFQDMRSLEIGSSALDGSDYRRLTNHEALDSNPAWSPDGNRIAFFSNRENVRGAIYTMAADGSDVHGMTPPSLYVLQESPLWSPDGRYIAFFVQEEGGRALYTVGADGSGLTRVSGAHVAVWSPDGNRIAFGVDDERKLRLYTSYPDGSDVREVAPWQPRWPVVFRVRDSRTEGYLFWSPDGSEILFLAQNRRGRPGIYAYAIDGSSFRVIAEGLSFGSRNIAFSPDGSRIAIRYEAHPSIVMYTVAADGSDPRGLVWDLGERHDPNVVPAQPNVENLVTQTTASEQLEQPEPLVDVTATPTAPPP